MKYTRAQLIDALQNEYEYEYEYLCHDDFDPDVDMTMEEHLEWLDTLTIEELVKETDTDNESYTLDEFMHNHS
jgi:diadenosine tetraphosphatase ApaH/serine/threonine PP2A family protein phosphatase